MKNLALILICSTMLFACNKAVDCRLGFGGDNCDVQITPQSLTINSADISAFPATDLAGLEWDLAGNPDIFFRIYRGETQIYQSEIKTDALPGTPLVFTSGTPFNIENVTDAFTMTFFDDDGALGSQEMGSFGISLYSSTNNFPDFITYTNPGGTAFVFSLHVAYNY